MKLTLLLNLTLASTALAQVVPTTPTKFSKKILGGGSSSANTSITAPSKAVPTVQILTYITLSPPRQWTSRDGKTLLGKLIAFTDPTAQPQPSAKPVIIKGGKARLLINQKPFEVALDQLSPKDQDFIKKIHTAIVTQ